MLKRVFLKSFLSVKYIAILSGIARETCRINSPKNDKNKVKNKYTYFWFFSNSKNVKIESRRKNMKYWVVIYPIAV